MKKFSASRMLRQCESVTNEPEAVSFSASPPATKKSKKNEFAWSDAVSCFSSSPAVNKEDGELEKLKISIADNTSAKLFSVIFDDKIISFLLDQSLIYAKQDNRHKFSSTMAEIKAFVGFLLFSGYDKLPREGMHWSLDADCNTTTSYVTQ